MGDSQLFLAGGVGIILLIMLDVVWTTLTTQGSGPISRLVTVATDKASKAAASLFRSRSILASTGPVAIVLLSSIWLLSLWLGWVLVFSAFPSGVVNAQSGLPASLAERIYFVGYTLSTLGLGDFRPGGGGPMGLTILASFNGLVLVTLVITYAVPLVQAAVMRRKMAFSISLLGSSPQEMAETGWRRENREPFDQALDSITIDVVQCSEQRVAYPMLDLFYDRNPRFSPGLQLAVLDEALNLIELGMQPDHRRKSLAIVKARKVISHYIDRVYIHSAEAAGTAPPLPGTDLLKQRNVPVADNLAPAFEPLARRRLRLYWLVCREGWEWGSINAAKGG